MARTLAWEKLRWMLEAQAVEAEVADTHAGDVEREGNREEGHRCRHGQPRLEQDVAQGAKLDHKALAEGEFVAGGEAGCRPVSWTPLVWAMMRAIRSSEG